MGHTGNAANVFPNVSTRRANAIKSAKRSKSPGRRRSVNENASVKFQTVTMIVSTTVKDYYVPIVTI